MSDVVAHIKELLFVKRWSKEQIVERRDSSQNDEWECLLCVNKQSLAVVRACAGDGMCDDDVSLVVTEMAKHSVKVGFAYHHPDNIHLVSTLSEEVEVRQMDEFMSPGELLYFIYGHYNQRSPMFILLPKLLKDTLSLFIAFIDGLFALFNKQEKTLGYYEPLDRLSNLPDEDSLYDYLRENYSRHKVDPNPDYDNTDRFLPDAILIPYEEAQTFGDGNIQLRELIVSGTSHGNKERLIRLSLDDIRERNHIYSEIEDLYEQKHQKDYSVESNTSTSENLKNLTIERPEHETYNDIPSSKESTPPSVEIEIPAIERVKVVKKYPKYEKVIINDINMARQTSYQTQIELASDLKRYLHGFQERLAEVAKNYQAKSHDLYEAGMMDETHKDFEENYVRETVAHIAGVVELINERDIPFVQKYIDNMEELRDQYGK